FENTEGISSRCHLGRGRQPDARLFWCDFGQYGWSCVWRFITGISKGAVIPWIEFKTPVIVRGRYKVWVGWRTRTDDGGNTVRTYINGEQLSRTLNNGEYRIRTLPERELEALGYKKHIAGSPS